MAGPLLTARLTEEPNRPLYHYTSVDGLYGILGSQSLRASAIQYLNDSLEFKHALGVAREYLYRREKESSEAVRRLLQSLRDQLERIEMFTVCAFSFSEDGDLLSQWRAYCPPGGGYSIGFRGNELRGRLIQQGCSLVRCVYDREEQMALVADALDPFVRELPTTEFPTDEGEFNRLRFPHDNEMFRRLAPVAPLIKHESFKEEKEWRAICALSSDGREDSTSEGPRDAYPLCHTPSRHSSGSNATHGIIIGPTQHYYIAALSLGEFARLNGQEFPQGIQTSRVPYREL